MCTGSQCTENISPNNDISFEKKQSKSTFPYNPNSQANLSTSKLYWVQYVYNWVANLIFCFCLSFKMAENMDQTVRLRVLIDHEIKKLVSNSTIHSARFKLTSQKNLAFNTKI